jgi:hypothetical protein
MKKSTVCGFALALGSAPAMAGVHMIPSAPGMTPDPNNPGVWKTAPMSNGQQLVVSWAVHTKFPSAHWAGVRTVAHVLDSNEVTLSNIIMNPGFLPQQSIPGPPASSVGVAATWWHPSATQSGIVVAPSQSFAFGSWTITVGGTTPANNSDVDLTVHASSIFHLGSNAESDIIVLLPSEYVWGTSNFEPTPEQPFPEFPQEPGSPGWHWVHVGQTISWHVTTNSPFASGFYTKRIGSSGLGIEHVPAPGAGLMMLAGGFGALGARQRAGRRRLT